MKDGSPISHEYKSARELLTKKESIIPTVTLYPLSDPNKREAFYEAVHNYPQRDTVMPWQTGNILIEALQRGILVDRVDSQLEDYAKLKRPKGYFEAKPEVLDRYTKLVDTWENSTIAEFSWAQKGRFVRILNENEFYQTAFSRNKYIFSDKVQQALKDTTFAIDGMGVGTSIAYLLVLSGAQNFVVADGGSVTLHDHNRLIGSSVRETGINHAIKWAQMAYEVNPYLKIRTFDQNIGIESNKNNQEVRVEKFLEGVEILIEEADALPIKIAARQKAHEKGIPNIMGSDLGFGASVQMEEPNAALFQGRIHEDDIQKILDPKVSFQVKTQYAIKLVGLENIPQSYLYALQQAQKDNASYWPQPGIAAFESAALVVAAIIARFEGSAIKSEVSFDSKKLLQK